MKKKNPTDSTLRNVRAAKDKLAKLKAKVKVQDVLLRALAKRVTALEQGR